MTPWVVDGRKYVIAGIGTSGWADPALKERVVVAFGSENAGAGSFLKQVGVAPERTPKGYAAAVPHVAVFEVTPA